MLLRLWLEKDSGGKKWKGMSVGIAKHVIYVRQVKSC